MYRLYFLVFLHNILCLYIIVSYFRIIGTCEESLEESRTCRVLQHCGKIYSLKNEKHIFGHGCPKTENMGK